MRSVLVAAVVTAALLVPARIASPVRPVPKIPVLPAVPAGVRHLPPVDAPIVDYFRPPASAYGPGNRGIDYATGEGSPVRASADGLVVFAGPVGGRLHVVIGHADGVRTSYSFLAAISVHRGQSVSGGEEVGRAGPSLHFGARRGEVYFDPLTLFGRGGRTRVHLVPDEPAPRT